MGYSARYHAASLVAVFVALAVGILIGVGFGSDIVSGTAEDLERSLESDLDEAEAEIDNLERELAREADFGEAIYPAVVSGALARKHVALVAFGELSDEVSDDVEEALAPSGATLREVAIVRESPDLEALAATISGRRAREVERGGEELGRLARRAGRALLRGGKPFERLRGALLARFSGRPAGVDAVVVARSRPSDLGPATTEITDRFERALIDGMRSSGADLVGVERSDADPSSIGAFRAAGISTVDSVDLHSGQVALVFALRGAEGDFGIKDSADSLLPDLLARPRSGGRGGR